jgi:hypothetical protein
VLGCAAGLIEAGCAISIMLTTGSTEEALERLPDHSIVG